MENSIINPLFVLLLVLGASLPIIAQANSDSSGSPGVVYTVTASNPVLIRRVTGPVSNSINGVIAEPVDSFDWAGQNVTPIKGEAKLEVDPYTNTGSI